MTHELASTTKAWTTLRGREVVALGRELLGGNGIVGDFLVRSKDSEACDLKMLSAPVVACCPQVRRCPLHVDHEVGGSHCHLCTPVPYSKARGIFHLSVTNESLSSRRTSGGHEWNCMWQLCHLQSM